MPPLRIIPYTPLAVMLIGLALAVVAYRQWRAEAAFAHVLTAHDRRANAS